MDLFSAHCLLRYHFATGDEVELEEHWYKESSFWEEYQAGYRISATIKYSMELMENVERCLQSLPDDHRKAICDYYKQRTKKRPVTAIRNFVVILPSPNIHSKIQQGR